MNFTIPKGEDAVYHELAGDFMSIDEVKQLVADKKILCHVEDMQMSMMVACEHAPRVYRMLSTGGCKFGLVGIDIYRLALPIRVDDVEGKRHYRFVADMEFIDNEKSPTVDTEA